MAIWQDLVQYVRRNYKVDEETPNSLRLIFDTGNLRSQVVMLWHVTLMDGKEDWLQIESPVADLDAVDLKQALDEVGDLVCGGLSVVQDLLTLRHSVPL